MQRFMSVDEQSEIKKLKDRNFITKYKTEICKNWLTGSCEFGEQCAFAHGYNQLRSKKQQQQQQRAQKLLLNPVIQAAQIQHQFMLDKKPRSISEDFVNKYKTELCRNWEMEGYCTFGLQCSYAHGSEELRRKHSGLEISNLYNSSAAMQVKQPQAIPYQYYQDVQSYDQSAENASNFQSYQQYPYTNYSQQSLQNAPQYYNPQTQQVNQNQQQYESQNYLYEQDQYNQQRRRTDPVQAVQTQNQTAQMERRGSEQFINKIQQINQKPSNIALKLNVNDMRRLSAQSNASTQISTCANPQNIVHEFFKNNQISEQKSENNEKDREITYVKSLLGDQLLDELEKSPTQHTKRLSVEDKNIKSEGIQQSQSSQELKTAAKSLSQSQKFFNQLNPLKEYSYFT